MATKIKIPKKFVHGRIKRRGISPGGGGSVIPLANLAAWFKADAIVGLADDDPVASWIDSSGNNNAAAQGTAGNRPVYKTGIAGGLPVVRFDGVDDFLESPYAASDGPHSNQTWFAVFRTNNTSTQQVVVWMGESAGNGFGAENEIHMNVADFFSAGDKVGAYVGGLNGVPGSIISLADTVGFHVLVARFDNLATVPTVQAFLDGVAGSLVTSGAGPEIVNWTGNSRLGAPGTLARLFSGDLAEVLIYNASMPASQQSLIEAYLASKYGIP